MRLSVKDKGLSVDGADGEYDVCVAMTDDVKCCPRVSGPAPTTTTITQPSEFWTRIVLRVSFGERTKNWRVKRFKPDDMASCHTVSNTVHNVLRYSTRVPPYGF